MYRLIGILLCVSFSANAQEYSSVGGPSELDAPRRQVVVNVVDAAPMAMKSEAGITGFDVDLWKLVAFEIGLSSDDYRFEFSPFAEVFDRLRLKHVDVALAGITITHERETHFDFSHPYLDSGLAVLVHAEESAEGEWSMFKEIFTPRRLKWLGYFLLFVLVMAHWVWFVEKDDGEMFQGTYRHGLFEAMYFVLVTMTTVGYGDYSPRSRGGKVVVVVLMLCSLPFYGIAIGEITSSMTAEKMDVGIQKPSDLAGRNVATVFGSTSVDSLRDLDARVVPVDSIEDAYAHLESGKVDAVVFDAPMLWFYAQHEGSGRVRVVGQTFERQYYGILLSQGNALREEVNRALLKLRNNGQLDRLRRKWFGEEGAL